VNVSESYPARHNTRSRMSASTPGASLLRNSQTAFALLIFLPATIALCQETPIESSSQESQPAQTQTQPLAQPQSPTPTTPQRYPEASRSVIIDPNAETLHHSHRIMGVLPNFTAVDSNTHLPRLSTGEKFDMALHDSVDYSAVLLVAGLAGKGLYSNSIPPSAPAPVASAVTTGERSPIRFLVLSSPRLSSPLSPTRIPATTLSARTDSLSVPATPSAAHSSQRTNRGTHEFNISEIGGNASEAALSNLYYPASERASANPPRTSPHRW
jgi:hypothetical protein